MYVDVCVLCPSLGIQSCSIFVPHFSHQYFTPSPPLLSIFSLAPSLFLGHQNEVLSMLHHTPLKDWLAGWLAGIPLGRYELRLVL